MKPQPTAVVDANASYERWLGAHLRLLPGDLRRKHAAMAEGVFPFLRATFFRWAQRWPAICPEVTGAPEVLAVGDLHVENFGTWRDIEGRLVWGVNDFDEAWPLPYTSDLVRLAASALLAAKEEHLSLEGKTVCEAVLEGYAEALDRGGRAFVLAEHHGPLREMAVHRLKDPLVFWSKLEQMPGLRQDPPAGARKALRQMLPDPELAVRYVHRVAGLGSLGRERFLAVGEWHGGRVAREAKALAPSACSWATGTPATEADIHYQEVIDRSVRCPDPFVRLKRRWIVRRLAPDCSRIELGTLPRERDELRLLHAMGWETANVHLGTARAKALKADLRARPAGWLHRTAQRMLDVVHSDWEGWRAHHKQRE